MSQSTAAATQSLPQAQARESEPPRKGSVLDQILDHQSALSLGKELVPTGYLPDHIKNAQQAMAIILTGQELGMKPMRALRSLVMVKGKVTESADSQLARFKGDGGRSRFEKLDETQAVLWLRHPNGDEHTETFTLEDARKAGLVSAGGMYQKYAKAMLRSRAITAGLKSIGWEGGVGNYDPDELAPSIREAEEEARGATQEAVEDATRAPQGATEAQLERLRELAGHHATPAAVRQRVHAAIAAGDLSSRKAGAWISRMKAAADASASDVSPVDPMPVHPATGSPSRAVPVVEYGEASWEDVGEALRDGPRDTDPYNLNEPALPLGDARPAGRDALRDG